mgnify:CR=1 FL=1|tara:strand:+ start:385 stop:789 length:405 start_codon:yes stop_codon:yes gene_type:complete
MAIFKSDTFLVTVGNDVISNFLRDPKNLIEILPQDRIEDWKADDTTCSFKIKGLASIFLSLESAEKHTVIFKSNSEKPFSFRLIVDLVENIGVTDLSARFDADVNAFMGTMLKGPLTNFLNHLGAEIKAKYSES